MLDFFKPVRMSTAGNRNNLLPSMFSPWLNLEVINRWRKDRADFVVEIVGRVRGHPLLSWFKTTL
jgi:hypothetical protein